MNKNNNATATVTVISSTTFAGMDLAHVRITERNGFGRGVGERDYHVATSDGLSSGYCATGVEACDRLRKLMEHGGDHAAAGISQSPNGICNEREMATAVGHFDAGLRYRDGGVCEHAVRTGHAAGLLSPEWVVASWYVGQNGLWR